MTRYEAALLDELFDGDTPLRRAVFCTYTFDPVYFGEVIVPRLLERGCERALVLMDVTRYQAISRLDDLGDHGRVLLERFPAGRLFHPKVFVLAGQGRCRAVVGSANLTRAGLADNRELFSRFTEADVDLAPVAHWLAALSQVGGLGRSARDVLRETEAEVRAAQLGQPERASLPLLSGGLQGETLWSRLEHLRQERSVSRAVVVSPYFEAPEAFDTGLLAGWLDSGVQVDLYASRDQAQSRVPRDEIAALLKKHPRRLQLYGLPTKGRTLHAKLIALLGRSRAWLLSGSANFTAAALRGHNVETGLLLECSREEAEAYLQRLLAGARPMAPADLPAPAPILPQEITSKTGFLSAAVISLTRDELRLYLTRPRDELASQKVTWRLTIGGREMDVPPAWWADDQTLVVGPASPYLKLPDGGWQLGGVILETADAGAHDWRLIELAEGETLTEAGALTEKPLDLETYVAGLLNPRLLAPGGNGKPKRPGRGGAVRREAGFQDVEGSLDRTFRLAAGLDAHFARLITDPYTVHRWRADLRRLTELLAVNPDVLRPIEQALLAGKLVARIESALAHDGTEAKRWFDDERLRSDLGQLLALAALNPVSECPTLKQALSEAAYDL